MGNLIFILIVFGVGFWIGRKTSPKQAERERTKYSHTPIYSFNQRQALKVMYRSDAERIRELNLLSTNEGKFMRLLINEIVGYEIIVKNNRFFLVDTDKFPVAIFEYRDGKQAFRTNDVEDGLPIFVYKGLISSDAIKEDLQRIKEMRLSPLN